jgi:predicted amidohydrolase
VTGYLFRWRNNLGRAMNKRFKVAAVQMVSSPDIAQNCEIARELVSQAASQGAQLVLLPEYWAVMGLHEKDKLALAEQVGQGTIQSFMSAVASEFGVWLIGGTMPLATAGPDVASEQVWNTTLVFDPTGKQVSRYDKIHLFSFHRGEEAFEEARTIKHGSDVVTFDAPFGKTGLSVCYDLRFPELYRAMGDCTLIVVPAAFTYTTGQAHWEVLLRARAIENQCYVLASAQGGLHVNGRRTWGHTMLIDPWGVIQSVLPEGAGVVIGEIDADKLQHVRDILPAIRHRRL